MSAYTLKEKHFFATKLLPDKKSDARDVFFNLIGARNKGIEIMMKNNSIRIHFYLDGRSFQRLHHN